MAARKGKGGLDLSGVNKKSRKISGGSAKAQTGFDVRTGAGTSSRRRGAYIHPGGKFSKRNGPSRKAIVLVIVGILAALALATGVGLLVYQQVVSNALKPDLNMESLEQVLVDPESDESPCWGLFVKTDAASAEIERGTLEELALVHVDTDNKSISFLWLPPNARVYIDGYGYRSVSEAFELSGEIGAITAASKLATVDISHYFEANEAGLDRFEELLGPLSTDAPVIGRNVVTTALCRKIFGSATEQTASVAEAFTTCFGTDLSDEKATTLFQSLQGMDLDNEIFQVDAPIDEENSADEKYIVLENDAWNTMVTRVNNGMSPVASQSEISSNEVLRRSTSVVIWNGVGVSGVAKDCANELKKLGWSVGDTGNAAQFVYDETLVVYKDTDDEELAQLLVSDLGQGRVVRSAARYSFEGRVLVVVGKDYKPY